MIVLVLFINDDRFGRRPDKLEEELINNRYFPIKHVNLF